MTIFELTLSVAAGPSMIFTGWKLMLFGYKKRKQGKELNDVQTSVIGFPIMVASIPLIALGIMNIPFKFVKLDLATYAASGPSIIFAGWSLLFYGDKRRKQGKELNDVQSFVTGFLIMAVSILPMVTGAFWLLIAVFIIASRLK